MSIEKLTRINLSEEIGESTVIQKIIEDLVKKAHAEKERLLFQRCVERITTDEAINFNDEAKKMFPRIKAVRDHEGEHWYWNDGTDGGLHLISYFENKGFDFISDPAKAITVFTYK